MNLSFESLSNINFKDVPDLPDYIKGSNFYWENMNPDKAVVEYDRFSSDIICTFERCNMTNIKKHPGMTYVDCSADTICVQTDLMDWRTDKQGNPISPTDIYSFNLWGISLDPKDIIKVSTNIPVTQEVQEQLDNMI